VSTGYSLQAGSASQRPVEGTAGCLASHLYTPPCTSQPRSTSRTLASAPFRKVQQVHGLRRPLRGAPTHSCSWSASALSAATHVRWQACTDAPSLSRRRIEPTSPQLGASIANPIEVEHLKQQRWAMRFCMSTCAWVTPQAVARLQVRPCACDVSHPPHGETGIA
jgi:hypothetical protein